MELVKKNLDYLDIQIIRQRENFLIEDEGRVLTDGDSLPYVLKQKLGISFKRVGFYSKILYENEDKSIFLYVKDTQTSLQLKGKFFLNKNWEEVLVKIFKVISENSWHFHITRIDLALTYKTSLDLNLISKKLDYKNLLVRTYRKKKETTYIKASNSSIEVVLYDKSLQVNDVKDEKYKEMFKQEFSDTDSLKRLELRLKNKRTNTKITQKIINYNKQEIEKIIFEEIFKRIRIKSKKFFNL